MQRYKQTTLEASLPGLRVARPRLTYSPPEPPGYLVLTEVDDGSCFPIESAVKLPDDPFEAREMERAFRKLVEQSLTISLRFAVERERITQVEVQARGAGDPRGGNARFGLADFSLSRETLRQLKAMSTDELKDFLTQAENDLL